MTIYFQEGTPEEEQGPMLPVYRPGKVGSRLRARASFRGSGFRAKGGFRVQAFGFRAYGGFRVQGSGFKA